MVDPGQGHAGQVRQLVLQLHKKDLGGGGGVNYFSGLNSTFFTHTGANSYHTLVNIFTVR